MRITRVLLPRTLIGRVFALYSTALILFVVTGLGMFFRNEFNFKLRQAGQHAQAIVEIAGPMLAQASAKRDIDAISRVLDQTINRSVFDSAEFSGSDHVGVLSLNSQPSDLRAPTWLRDVMQKRLSDVRVAVPLQHAGLGEVRLSFAADRVAGEIWTRAQNALLLAVFGLICGLVLIRLPLKYWLGDLKRIRVLEKELHDGSAPSPSPRGLSRNAPAEFKKAFDALNRAATSIQAQREQAEATLSAIGDGVLTLDERSRVVLANPAACSMLASTADALLGQSATEIFPLLFIEEGVCPTWRSQRNEIKLATGRTLVIESTLSPILGAQYEVHGFVLAFRDVSDQHALDQRLRDELKTRETAMNALRGVLEGLMPEAIGPEAALATDDLAAITDLISHLVARVQERGEQLNAIFALSPDGFVSFDQYGLVNYVSPAFATLTGLPTAQVNGLNERQLALAISAQCGEGAKRIADFDMLRERQGAQDERVLIELERPTRRMLEAGLRQSRASMAISQVLYLRDVTHETEVDQLKSEFLSTAAHELRTPMASIYGFAELMMMKPLPPEKQKAVIETIHRQTELMLNIVNELLDLARIEARRGKDFELEHADLRIIATQVAQDFNPPAGRSALTASLPAQPVLVRVDRQKMTQALVNVISNAYKYSPNGGEVSLALIERDLHGARQAGIQVKDCGIGMTPEQLARVSERFYRADASGTIPGTGLGMSIVKEIIELLGGEMQLASEYGVGTTVTLWLPLAGVSSKSAIDVEAVVAHH